MRFYEKTPDTYSQADTLVTGGAVIKVYVPDLSDEERERRMEAIRDAAASVIRAAWEAEKKN